jgi:membrane protein DedA with SNARE-associated domain
MASYSNLKLRDKSPQLLVLTIIAIVVAIILLDTLEDILIEGGAFTGTPLAVLLNAIAAFTQNVTAIVQSWGYAGLFALMALESSSLPIPSEVILPFAGYLVSQGLLNFWVAVLVSTLAGLAGSLVDYYIGLKGMSVLAKRNTLRNFLYNKGRMDTAERWFKKYGAPTVFLSRLVPGFRTLISFPAGAVKMPLSKFIAYTTAGCLFWDIILIYIGVYVGASWREVAGVVHYLIIAVAIVVLMMLVLFLFERRKNLKQQESSFSSRFN